MEYKWDGMRPYDYTCFGGRYFIWKRNICVMYKYRVHCTFQNRLLHTLIREKLGWITQTNTFFGKHKYEQYKQTFLFYNVQKKTTFKKFKDDLLKTQSEYLLQNMYNHMVGRAGSIPSPLYSILQVVSD